MQARATSTVHDRDYAGRPCDIFDRTGGFSPTALILHHRVDPSIVEDVSDTASGVSGDRRKAN